MLENRTDLLALVGHALLSDGEGFLLEGGSDAGRAEGEPVRIQSKACCGADRPRVRSRALQFREQEEF